jgi:hypothetical protein
MTDERSCSKCNYVAEQDVTRCPQCKAWMPKARSIRRRGFLLVFIGLFLEVMMTVISIMVVPTMLSKSPTGAGFTGTPEQASLIMTLFGLIILFGFMSIVIGMWQVVTGRRNIWLVLLMLLVTVVLIGSCFAMSKGIGPASGRGIGLLRSGN